MDRSGPRLIDQKVFGAERHGMDDRRHRKDAGSATCRAGITLVLVVGGVGTTLRSPVIAAIGVHYRSEEHTSELQSLMRISYAVFCLKKKNNYNTYTNTPSNQQTL